MVEWHLRDIIIENTKWGILHAKDWSTEALPPRSFGVAPNQNPGALDENNSGLHQPTTVDNDSRGSNADVGGASREDTSAKSAQTKYSGHPRLVIDNNSDNNSSHGPDGDIATVTHQAQNDNSAQDTSKHSAHTNVVSSNTAQKPNVPISLPVRLDNEKVNGKQAEDASNAADSDGQNSDGADDADGAVSRTGKKKRRKKKRGNAPNTLGIVCWSLNNCLSYCRLSPWASLRILQPTKGWFLIPKLF